MRRVSLPWILTYSAAKVGIGLHDMLYNAVVGLFLRDTYHLSNMAIGFLANERSFLGAVLQPVIGGISDRTRSPLGCRRPFILFTIPVTVASLLLISLYPPTWLAVALFIIGPLFLSLAVIPYQALLPDNVVPEQRGTVSGITVVLGMAGGVSLLLLAKLLYEHHEALVFIIVAATLGTGTLITVAAVREPAVPPRPGPAPRLRPLTYVADLLHYREAVKYVACFFCFWFGIGGVTPFLTRFGKEELGVPEGDTFVLLLVVVITTMLFATPAGWLGDRFGKKRATSWGLLAFAVLMLVSSQTQKVEQALPLLALAGLAQAVTATLAYPLFTELVPTRRMGEMTGLSTMIWSLAQPLGATLLGALADQTGTLRTVLAGAGVAMTLAFAILQTVRMPAVAAADTLSGKPVSVE